MESYANVNLSSCSVKLPVAGLTALDSQYSVNKAIFGMVVHNFELC